MKLLGHELFTIRKFLILFNYQILNYFEFYLFFCQVIKYVFQGIDSSYFHFQTC